MVKPWYMELGLQSHNMQDLLSKQELLKLRRFYMQQLALSQALLEAKPLGICKITMSERNGILERLPTGDEELECIPSRRDSREMLS